MRPPPDASLAPVTTNGAIVPVRRPHADQHPPSVYLAGLAPGSRRAMQHAIERIAELLTGGRCTVFTLPWGALRYQHTAAVRSALAELYATATANRMLSALRGVLKACWRLGQMPTDEYQRAIDIPAIRGETLPRGRALSLGELHSLFTQCAKDEGTAGVRDAALIAVLYGVGLRRAEAVALDLADYDVEQGALTIRSGKGNKGRVTYAGSTVQEALAQWLQARGSKAGPLFLPFTRGGRLAARRLHSQTVLDMLRRRARQSGVAVLSPHDLRRTFISNLLDAGVDITTVQKLAGHASVNTTSRYDRRGEVVKKLAVTKLQVPFVRRVDLQTQDSPKRRKKGSDSAPTGQTPAATPETPAKRKTRLMDGAQLAGRGLFEVHFS